MWPIKPVELTTFASGRECVPTQSHPFLITKHESLILTEEQRNGWSGVCVQRHRSSFMVSRQTSCGLLLPLRPFWVSVLELGLKCSSVIWKKIPDPYIVIGFTWCYLFTRQANDLKASSWEACLPLCWALVDALLGWDSTDRPFQDCYPGGCGCTDISARTSYCNKTYF